MGQIKPSSMWVRLVVILPLLWKGITCQVVHLAGYSIQVSHSVIVQEGDSITIACTFKANRKNTFSNSFGYWIRMPHNSGHIVATNDKSSDAKKPNFYLTGNPDSGDCTLTITDARREDGGEYFFRFEGSKNIRVKYNYYREVTTAITVTDPPITITWEMNGSKKNKVDIIKVNEGSSVILKCSVQSPQTLTWKGEKNIFFQQNYRKELELRLEDMMMNHTGTYTCSARHYYITSSMNINITVQYPPRNMEVNIYSSKGEEHLAGPQVNINDTETLTLTCRAIGNPPVTVVWVRGEDGKEISKMNNSRLSATINVTSTMVDVYRCLAWNALGLKERRIHVGTKKVPMDGYKQPRDVNVFKCVTIGFICGISIATIIILLYIFFLRKIINKKKKKKRTEVTVKEIPANMDSPRDEISMNTIVHKRKPEETSDLQVNSRGVTSNPDVLYSEINFAAKRSKVPSSQPETEYAQVKRK